jgi:peptide/nickel transport system permease protein
VRGLARLAEALGIVWLAVTLAFFALQVVPGDAVIESLSASGVSPQVIASRQTALGLNDPPLVQYLRYLGGLAVGSLGVSLLDGRPVTEIVGQQAGATIALALAAATVMLGAGIPLGMLAATRGPKAWAGRVLLALMMSIPVLWLGTLAIAAFGPPVASAGPLGELILPALVLGLSGAGALGIVAEQSLGDTMRQPFVTTARSKGLPEHDVRVRHVLRAAAGPILIAFTLQLGFLLGGAVLTEALFNRPGLGRLLAQAALRQDYPVVLGIVAWSAVAYAALLLIADVLARRLDPRIGAES